MKISSRLSAALLVTVLLAVGSTGLVSWRLVARPIVDELRAVMVRVTLGVAERIDAGEPVDAVAQDVRLSIESIERPPDAWKQQRHLGRALWTPREADQGLAVQTREGWFVVRRHRAVVPRGQIALWMGVLVLALAGVAALLARVAMAPLRTASAAMRRLAEGNLEHRLPGGGPSEVRQLALTFNHMADRVSELLAAERLTLATISHDLRTPLSRLRLQVELLRREGGDAARLDRVERDAELLESQIEDALEVSRLRSAEPELGWEPLDLADLARDALAEFDHPVEAELESTVVYGDRKLLLRAIRNVLANAERHALTKTPIRVSAADGALQIRDFGPGIAEEAIERVFDPFYRLSTEVQGTGLGLMIVRRVMELHGAAVRLHNEDPGLRVVLAFDLEAQRHRAANGNNNRQPPQR